MTAKDLLQQVRNMASIYMEGKIVAYRIGVVAVVLRKTIASNG
jgi:hypothetical protein